MNQRESMNYPIGQRGEAVWYDIQTTCYGLIKMLMGFCTDEGELEDTYFFSYDGGAHDIVDLVEKAQTFTDGHTAISYSILDTDEQDWGATIHIIDGKITEVMEEAIEH